MDTYMSIWLFSPVGDLRQKIWYWREQNEENCTYWRDTTIA